MLLQTTGNTRRTLNTLSGPNSPVGSPARKACIWTTEEEARFLAGLQLYKTNFDAMHALLFPTKTIQELHSHFMSLKRSLAHPSPRNDTPIMKEMKQTIDRLEAEITRENKENLCWPTNLIEKEEPQPEEPSIEEILRKVHLLVERCIFAHMTKEETMYVLNQQYGVELVVTRTVWEKLEEQNPIFFRDHNAKLAELNSGVESLCAFSSPKI
eukprot:TRINITY_DN1372_c0_g1_i1.p1 TRINITY_DN1372_c0_g1~~TRINITY_DN1372_c0_g1_i1.p1  ORF type:complete len:212 (-),score=42.46 TRINITY_DN1372_c0_g1_i1:152-787(-)